MGSLAIGLDLPSPLFLLILFKGQEIYTKKQGAY
ncbi:hypothetical protein HBHAL_5044 [Halobacillus halophilus DSM 2266]|uniref:Uncharacterized protein n=1 Tax=Halobacillus halophilus (strain ATCC 35676 / DSM 2266 / JCM 20832 / KCTC 3685 / LMG 17431 / NBRC 102448 / NCIMB 2269) TaxID=866895 RepID=I0JTA7_HALH3|nr:hypothetical protein HBHAL_5044 [Halobacillus halophilus DSM 2266]